MSKTLLSTTTGFVYDGPNPVQEQQGSTVTANLLTGGVDERFQRTDSTGAYSYLTDALGSTEALTTSTGAEQATYTYSPYGAMSISGSTTNSYDYTGRESDGLGILYYRARYYNPNIGRFLSEDPAGFAGSGPDLYEYVGGDPIDFNDPFGMDRNAPNNATTPQQPPKPPCNPSTRIAGMLKAADGLSTTLIMSNLAALHYAAGGFIIGVTCGTPEPGEPLACAAGIFGGGSLFAGGTVLGYGAYKVATDEMIPGIKQAITCQE